MQNVRIFKCEQFGFLLAPLFKRVGRAFRKNENYFGAFSFKMDFLESGFIVELSFDIMKNKALFSDKPHDAHLLKPNGWKER